MTWSKKKYHAVRLHHNPTGEVLVPSQRQGISVVYEIWLGQRMVGRVIDRSQSTNAVSKLVIFYVG